MIYGYVITRAEEPNHSPALLLSQKPENKNRTH